MCKKCHLWEWPGATVVSDERLCLAGIVNTEHMTIPSWGSALFAKNGRESVRNTHWENVSRNVQCPRGARMVRTLSACPCGEVCTSGMSEGLRVGRGNSGASPPRRRRIERPGIRHPLQPPPLSIDRRGRAVSALWIQLWAQEGSACSCSQAWVTSYILRCWSFTFPCDGTELPVFLHDSTLDSCGW